MAKKVTKKKRTRPSEELHGSLTIYGPGKMTDKERRLVADWLAGLAKQLQPASAGGVPEFTTGRFGAKLFKHRFLPKT